MTLLPSILKVRATDAGCRQRVCVIFLPDLLQLAAIVVCIVSITAAEPASPDGAACESDSKGLIL